MEFRVLGPMEVLEGGRRLDLGPRMPQAVLALLVMSVNRVVSIDRLIDQLWGDTPPPTATGTLHGYVSRLRRALEPDRRPGASARVLVTQPPGYALRAPADAVDAERFEALTRVGLAAMAQGRPRAASDALQRGLDLWRGAPYGDLAFESFIQTEIARLAELRASARECLAEAALAVGDHVGAISELERLVIADPLRERRWELLALAYYRSGRQAHALRTLGQARTTLVEELGLEPGPSLRRLESDILAQSTSLDWRPPPADGDGRPVATSAEPSLSTTPDVPPPPEGLLVGRASELASLAGALGDVGAGRSRIVLLSGEPGMGKTRLAEELAGLATAKGALVAWGQCHDGEMAPAFWPWVQVLSALVGQGDPESVRAALGIGASHIAKIVPEVKDVPGLEMSPITLMEPEAARGMLFGAVGTFVRRLASARPVVLVIDDLHWADVASLQLLQVVWREIQSAAVLLVCTYREHDAQAARPVMATLGQLGRQAGLVRIRPAGLGEADIAALVEEATGGPVPPGLAGAIRARTEGNPFFVSELVALLAPRLHHQGGDDELHRQIPAGVRDAIRLRLARLPEEGAGLLGVGAVIGRDFDLELLAASAGVDDDATLDALELALLVGVVVENAQSPGRFRFSHGLVRETLYDDLSATRRARLHRRVGEALERLHPDALPLADLAHHYLEGVAAGTVDKAITYAVELAGQAAAGFAFEMAEHQLDQALALLSSTPPSPGRWERELDVQIQRSSVLGIRRGHADPEVGKALARAGELSRQVGDSDRLLGSLRGAFFFALIGGELDNAQQIGRQFLELSQDGREVPFLAAAHRAAGTVAFCRGRLAEARHELEQAVVLADALDASSPVNIMNNRSVGVRNMLALALWLLGDVGESDRVSEEALSLARGSGVVVLVDALFLAGTRDALGGDHAAVLERADEALDLAAKHGIRLYDGSTRILRGWARAVQGQPESGLTEMKGALAAVQATGARLFGPFCRGLLADALERAGRPNDALAAVDDGLAEVEARGERFWEAELHRRRGVLLAAGTNPGGDAEASLVRSVQVAASQGSTILGARAAESLAGWRHAANSCGGEG